MPKNLNHLSHTNAESNRLPTGPQSEYTLILITPILTGLLLGTSTVAYSLNRPRNFQRTSTRNQTMSSRKQSSEIDVPRHRTRIREPSELGMTHEEVNPAQSFLQFRLMLIPCQAPATPAVRSTSPILIFLFQDFEFLWADLHPKVFVHRNKNVKQCHERFIFGFDRDYPRQVGRPQQEALH